MFTNTQTFIGSVGRLVEAAIVVVAGIALLVFMWGIAKYIFAQGNETAKADGKKVMGWGLVALFVMVSVWGIIAFFQRELGLPVTIQQRQDGGSASQNLNTGGQGNPVVPPVGGNSIRIRDRNFVDTPNL